MIQKNIHQIWFGNNKKPPQKIINSWIQFAKKFGWKYYFWNEMQFEKLNIKNIEIYNFYKNRLDYHGMSDIARIEILNQYGGIYSDVDFFNMQNDVENIISLNSDMLISSSEHCYPKKSQQHMKFNDFSGRVDCSFHIANGFLIAPKDNNILSFMLDEMSQTFKQNEEFINNSFIDCDGNHRLFCSADIVGCFLLTHCAKKFPFIMLPPKFIFCCPDYIINQSDKNFKKNIICSYIYNHDENSINNLII
jgi:hypothetical protein